MKECKRTFSANIFLCLCLIWSVNCYSYTKSTNYVGAVVDYSPTYSLQKVDRAQAIDIMLQNLKGYEKAIQEAKGLDKGLQIIIFPEDGLYGALLEDRSWAAPYTEYIPSIFNGFPYVNPCLNSSMATASPILHAASCLARKYEVVLVLDMGDSQACNQRADSDRCPLDGHYQYNTQVAFSETGQLLAKYHKSHLFFEPEWDVGNQEPVYFDTSFGVRFGLFICFDIMFSEPQQALLKEHGVHDIAYSTWWVNDPPYITGTQTQQAWSRLNQVNLLASGIGLSWYNSGSGIYSKGVPLASFYNSGQKPATRVLVATVATTIHHSALPPTLSTNRASTSTTRATAITTTTPTTTTRSKLFKHRYTPSSTNWVVKAFEATPGLKGNLTITSGTLTCEAFFAISSDSTTLRQQPQQRYDTFALVALNGIYHDLFPAQVCGLMLCPGPVKNASCTEYAMQGNTVFEYFSLHGTFSGKAQQLAMVASNNATLILRNNSYAVTPNGIEGNPSEWNAPPDLINVTIFGPVWS